MHRVVPTPCSRLDVLWLTFLVAILTVRTTFRGLIMKAVWLVRFLLLCTPLKPWARVLAGLLTTVHPTPVTALESSRYVPRAKRALADIVHMLMFSPRSLLQRLVMLFSLAGYMKAKLVGQKKKMS